MKNIIIVFGLIFSFLPHANIYSTEGKTLQEQVDFLNEEITTMQGTINNLNQDLMAIVYLNEVLKNSTLTIDQENKKLKNIINNLLITNNNLEDNNNNYLLEQLPSSSNWSESFPRSKFILIKKGLFEMGEGEGKHSVIITKDFFVTKFLVSQKEWYHTKKNNQSHFKEDSHCPGEWIVLNEVPMCPNNPVETITFQEAKNFIQKINESIPTDQNQYRLCTEAEIEYITKAGTNTAFFCGNDESQAKFFT